MLQSRKLLLLTFIFISVLQLKAATEFSPIIPNPLFEPWRWHTIAELPTNEFVDFSQDNSGTIWAVYSNAQNLLASYNGYSWESHPHKMPHPVGVVKRVACSGDSVLIGGSKGLLSYRNGTYSTIIDHFSDEVPNIDIIGIQSVWDSCLLINTNLGIAYKQSDKLYFFTRTHLADTLRNILPGFKVLSIPEEFYPEYRNDFYVNAISVCKDHHLWVFSQLDKHTTFDVERTGNTDCPLRFVKILNFNPAPQYGMETAALLSDEEIWLVSDTRYRIISHFDGKNWHGFDMAQLLGASNMHFSIVQMEDGHIYIGGQSAIFHYYRGVFREMKAPDLPIGSSTKVKLLKTANNNLLVGCDGKIFRVEYTDEYWKSYRDLLFQAHSSDGSLWFVSKANQVVHKKDNSWHTYDVSDGLMDIPLAVNVTSDGRTWCAGSHQGHACLAYLNGKRWHKQIFDTLAVTFSEHPAYEDPKGNLWYGASLLNKQPLKGGVVRVSADDKGGYTYTIYSIPAHIVAPFTPNPNGEFIAYSSYINYRFDPSVDNWIRFNLAGERINSATYDDQGNLWLASLNSGLLHWDKLGTKIFTVPKYLEGKRFSSMVWVNKQLWLVSDKQFYAFNGAYWASNQLPSELLMQSEHELRVGNQGEIWLNNYPDEWKNQAYYRNEVNIDAPFYTVCYHPDTIAPKMTHLESKATFEQKENCMISWEGTDYFQHTSTADLLYSYKLDNDEWSDFATTKTHTFLSLRHGHHCIEVRCMDTDFNLSHQVIKAEFRVVAPVYRQPWFVILISVLLIIILFLSFLTIRNNQQLRELNNNLLFTNQQLKEKQEEIIRQQDEIYQSKMRFFTNISHEFRTPLTLILDPIKKLLGVAEDISTDKPIAKSEKDEITKLTGLVQRNAKQLLHLVNEIMDFRKLDTGHMKLGARETDIVAFCDEIASTFSDLAHQKQIDFMINKGVHSLLLWVDRPKFSKVFSNLLSNAFKFTPNKGFIHITFSEKPLPTNPKLKNRLEIRDIEQPLTDFFEITIEDNGIGISQESITSIFTRFFQVDETDRHLGSGIGLALSKELVLLHKGEMLVQSARNCGSRFTIRLPLGQGHLSKEQMIQSADDDSISVMRPEVPPDNPSKKPVENASEAKPLLVVVDDNPDIRAYITGEFESYYRIETAADGDEGLKKILDTLPDLVISDVMMPQMNGLEMCKVLKSDIRTSHIPIVLLTARTSHEHQIEGLKTGADLYVPKPFDLELLAAQVGSMLSNRQQLIQKLKMQNEVLPDEVSVNLLDQKFIESINKAVKENYTNADYPVEELGKELGMGVRNLQLKLKSLTGITPSELLRNARIKHAEQLLQKTDLTVAEIAYQSGFNHPVYFNRIFKQKHNCTPRQYSKRFREDEV